MSNPSLRTRATQPPPADLLAQAKAMPPAGRGKRQTKYSVLMPILRELTEKGYNARAITDFVCQSLPWSAQPRNRVYNAIAYHIRVHILASN